ncbi:MAG: DUF899 domain-containing protein, partial [Fimbriimonadaceae bacterium]|nr:DUF899 domain-containing protein [Alphaproteobacteria bacterium]
MQNSVVSRDEWIAARKAFLDKEKQFTRQRDALSSERRRLPWVKVEKDYTFDGADGARSLADLFGCHSQLVIYHFMYGPDWQEGCPSCSFWADNFNNIPVHLAHRDVKLIATSKAPYEKLAAYKKRMGWTFDWFSTLSSDFSEDYQVTFSPEEVAEKRTYYNYRAGAFPG